MLPLPSSVLPRCPQKLTNVHNIEGQPVEEGVAHQLGKEQAKGEFYHALGGEKTSEEPPSPSLLQMVGFPPVFCLVDTPLMR